MAPARKEQPPSWLEELHEFSKLAAGVPYNALTKHYLDAGWLWALRETDVISCHDGTVCVSFDLVVGRSVTTLERLDSITMRMAPGPGPLSTAARIMAGPSVLFLLSGRLPPQPQAQQPAPMTNGADRVVEMPDRDVALDDDGGEYVDDDKPLDIIAKREPDGLPIFVDLYSLGDGTGKILDALLSSIEDFAGKAESPEQLDALYTRNADAMQFLKDFGDEQDKKTVRDLLSSHKTRLTASAAPARAPRRRAPREARH